MALTSTQAKPLRIPKSITLPFGYRVKVEQLSDRDIELVASNSDGVWLADQRLILLRRSLPIKRKAYILAHELGHAWLDWQHNYLDEGVMKQ